MNPVGAAMPMGAMPHGLVPVAIPPMAGHPMIPGAGPMVLQPTAVPIEACGTPNNTIYINNLNEKIKRDELKKSLYAVFVQFGQIIDIITSRTLKMRGQSFVVFDEVNSAVSALRAMQGFPLYEKPMHIQFSKVDSDVIAKRKGTFAPRPKQVNQAAAMKAAEVAAAAAAALEAAGPQGGNSARAIRRRQQRAAAAAAAAAAAGYPGEGGAAVPPPEGLTATSGDNRSAASIPPINPATIPDQPPNKILFLTNLPEDSDEAMLKMLFNQFSGYREVRMVPGRHDIAFVEFGNDMEAAGAKHGLQGFNIRPGRPIRITFAKK